jgi:hypothetical protein
MANEQTYIMIKPDGVQVRQGGDHTHQESPAGLAAMNDTCSSVRSLVGVPTGAAVAALLGACFPQRQQVGAPGMPLSCFESSLFAE